MEEPFWEWRLTSVRLINNLVQTFHTELLPADWMALGVSAKHIALEKLALTQLNISEIGTCKAVRGVVFWSEQDGHYKVMLNSNIIPRKKLFTLAHEIAHTLLHLNYYCINKASYTNKLTDILRHLNKLPSRLKDREELEANYFAVGLLRRSKVHCHILTQILESRHQMSAPVPSTNETRSGRSHEPALLMRLNNSGPEMPFPRTSEPTNL